MHARYLLSARKRTSTCGRERQSSIVTRVASRLISGSQLLFNRSRFRFSAHCTVRVRHVANRHPRSLIVRTPFACRVPHRRNPYITQWPGSSEREREGEERRACYANLGK